MVNDFSLSPRNKPKLIHGRIGENPVRVISESAQRFRGKKPGKERVLITHSISCRMDGHKSGALGEVLTTLYSVKCGGFAGIRKFAGINVMDAPRILTSEALWTYST